MTSRDTNGGAAPKGALTEPNQRGPLGQGAVADGNPAPWVAATEMLPDCQDEQTAMDDIDEASMESFPCSDPPSHHGTCHI